MIHRNLFLEDNIIMVVNLRICILSVLINSCCNKVQEFPSDFGIYQYINQRLSFLILLFQFSIKLSITLIR